MFRLFPAIVLCSALVSFGASAAEPTDAEVAKGLKDIFQQYSINAGRIGLPAGSSVTLDDLVIVQYKCEEDETPLSTERYKCAIVWTFKQATKQPVDVIVLDRNKRDEWDAFPVMPREHNAFLKKIGWTN